jgi:hypothetical protein
LFPLFHTENGFPFIGFMTAFGIASGLTGDSHAAEDGTQEALRANNRQQIPYRRFVIRQ